MIGAVLLYSYGAYIGILLTGAVHILYTDRKNIPEEIELVQLKFTNG